MFLEIREILGKGENAVYQPFSPSSTTISKGLFSRLDKVSLCGKGLTFPKQHILYSSKLKEFADDNFNFDVNGRMFS